MLLHIGFSRLHDNTTAAALLRRFPELERACSKTLRSARSVRQWNRLQPLSTFLPHPSRGDAGHGVNVCASRELQDGPACCAPLREVCASTRILATSAILARIVRLGSESSLDNHAKRWRVARAREDMRIRLRLGPRSAPPVLDCSALATDQAQGAASPHVGAALRRSNPVRPSSRRGHTRSRLALSPEARPLESLPKCPRFEKHGRLTYELSKLSRRLQQR